MKFPTKLNELDIIDLLNEYHSELRKLKQKMIFVKAKISELEDQLTVFKSKNKRVIEDDFTEESAEETPIAAEKPLEVKIPGKRGRKPKLVAESDRTAQPAEEKNRRRQRKLSDWDNMVLESLREKGKALTSSDLFAHFEAKAKESGLYETEEKLRFKLNQILVKLSNKRGELVKIDYPGRGFAYALPEWMNEKGKLLKEFMFEKVKETPTAKKKKITSKKGAIAKTGKRRGRKPKSASTKVSPTAEVSE